MMRLTHHVRLLLAGRKVSPVKLKSAVGQKPGGKKRRTLAQLLGPRPKSDGLRISGGDGQRIEIDQSVSSVGSHIRFMGSDNLISLGQSVKLDGADLSIRGHRNKIILESDCEFTGRILIKGNDQAVRLGKGTTTVDTYILCSEGCDVDIGEYCMFSRRIEIRTTDAHSLIDRQTGDRVNPARSVKIGRHVWVGVGCIINKGAVIPDDCVVGALSLVNRAFTEEGVVLAGAPARIVKRNITWDRKRQVHFKKTELDRWRSAVTAARRAGHPPASKE